MNRRTYLLRRSRHLLPICGVLLLCICPASLLAGSRWKELTDCRLIPQDYNDGDSFHVDCQGKEYIFRLYFVDAPESDDSIPSRVAEQAAHFKKSASRMLEVGQHAKKVTAQLLSRPFTVLTTFEDAKGRSQLPREFAFVTTGDGKDLGEVLVSQGLARSFGAPASPPGKTEEELRSKYDHLERTARRERLGAWGNGDEFRGDQPAEAKAAEDKPGETHEDFTDKTMDKLQSMTQEFVE
ncbi:MAG: thermonuclease family protein [Chthoniobacterales bacterium]|nr:thermonuclease family protein [Chthoniobacterales bacterium]